MTTYLKINCIVPSERSKPCLHLYFRWTGRTIDDSTGRALCPMCGTSWLTMVAADRAQHAMRTRNSTP